MGTPGRLDAPRTGGRMSKDSKRKKSQKHQKAQASAAPAMAQQGPFGAPAGPLPPLETPARAMVIVAHPDDAEFLCGGTVARWCAEGCEVVYVLVTGGDKGTHDPAMHPEKLAAIREEEQREACRALSVKHWEFLGYPDGFTSESAELRGQIVRLLRTYRPDVVITWDAFRGSFNHRDHRNVGQATMDAIYPIVRDRLFYQHHEDDGLIPHQVNEVLLAGAAEPNFTVDITAHWETKVEAILCHTSQIGGRTRDDFLKERAEREKSSPGKPLEEHFRRWSIRRPPRPGEATPKSGEPEGRQKAQREA